MTPFPLWKSNQGQVVVESLVSMAALGALISTLLISFYFLYGRLMVNHLGYSGVICAAQRQPSTICEAWVRDKIKTYLPFGEVQHLVITNKRHQFHITLIWSLKRFHRVEYKKSLRYGA